MKGKIECIRSSAFFRRLLFASLLILSLVLSSLSPLVASAAPGYDDDLQIAESIIIDKSNYYGSGVCPTIDATLDWSARFNDSATRYYGYANFIGGSEPVNSDANKNAVRASFATAVANAGEGGSWGVSTSSTIEGSGYEKGYYIFWNEDSPVSVTFDSGYVIATADHRAKVTYYNGNLGGGQNCHEIMINYMGAGSIGVSSDPDYQNAKGDPSLAFVSFADIKYPDGYSGVQVPDNGGGKTSIKPDFTYTVNNKDLQAKDYNLELPTIEPDEGYTIQGYSVEWSLFKCGSYSDVGNVCNDGELLKYQILDQNDSFNYSVADYADYHLKAQYLVQQCYRYPSYPATPDYCFYVDLGEELPDYDFTSTTVHLKIDGSDITGDTRDGECDESGFCEPPSPYEDCSTYGIDIVGGLGCVIRNFGVWLTNTLKMLFIPSGQFFNEIFKDFGDFFNKKLGFIAYPITFLITFFNDVMNAAGSPSCRIEGGTLFGVNTDVDLCTMQRSIPVIYNGIIIFIRSAVAFALIFALWRKYHEVVGEGGK